MFRDVIYTLDPKTGKYTFEEPVLNPQTKVKLSQIAPFIIDYLLAVQSMAPDYFRIFLAEHGRHVEKFAFGGRLFRALSINSKDEKKVKQLTAVEDVAVKAMLDPTIATNYFVLMYQLPIQTDEAVFNYILKVMNVFFEPILKHPRWQEFETLSMSGLTEEAKQTLLHQIKGAFCYVLQSNCAQKKTLKSPHLNLVTPILNDGISNFNQFMEPVTRETNKKIAQSIDVVINVNDFIEFIKLSSMTFIDQIYTNLMNGFNDLFVKGRHHGRRSNFLALGNDGYVMLNKKICQLVDAINLLIAEKDTPARQLALTNTLEAIISHFETHYLKHKKGMKKCPEMVLKSLQETCAHLAKANEKTRSKFEELGKKFAAVSLSSTKKGLFGLFSSSDSNEKEKESKRTSVAYSSINDSSSSSSSPSISPRTGEEATKPNVISSNSNSSVTSLKR